ncbi:hypothetical protein BGZ82_004865 [Podila clonocystis]|nr:hypothetical protein BGZ82_004865 [Podila clonocystis]
MLPASLGQPSTSHGKAPLNLVFIIDTHQPTDFNQAQATQAVLRLKTVLLRILLYFQGHMDERFQWSYQFFDSLTHQDIAVATNRQLQILSQSTLTACIDEYQRLITKPVAKHGSSLKVGHMSNSSPSVNLRTELVHSLADYGLGMSSYQSPMKPAPSRSQTLQKHFPPVAIRNYMYILSPLPRSWEDTVFFLEGKRHQDDTTSAGPRTHEILDVLQKVKGCFFDQGLWDRFLDNQLSLSWIDSRAHPSSEGPETTQTRISATVLIRSTMEMIMKAFGGHIIPYHALFGTLAPKDLYSFSTIFQSYRSTHISPGLGVKMSKANWQPLPSVQPGFTSTEPYPLRTVWTGDILLAESSKYLCSIELAESQSKVPSKSSQEQESSADEIQSIHVISRVSGTVIHSNLHTLSPSSTFLCSPHDGKNGPCERSKHILTSMRQAGDILLLEMTYASDSLDQNMDTADNTGSSTPDRESNRNTYTRHAVLYPTVPGFGLLQTLESKIALDQFVQTAPKRVDNRQFQMSMMEKPWGKLGGFVDQAKNRTHSKHSQLARTPENVLAWFKCPQLESHALPPLPPQSAAPPQANPFMEARSSSSKPVPGQTVAANQLFAKDIPQVESIDDLCLGVRKAYIEHLYQEGYSVIDYLKKLNAASKEITALAGKQAIALQEAQQKLVAFMIEFLRIWPSRMTSKYKQIGKELNIGKVAEIKSQDNYAILDDERPGLDRWKNTVSQSVKDSDVRMLLKKLKTKELEENKPFKKDPGAAKAVSSFMDDLCISASIDDRPAGMLSPQTPRSKGMDPAKKFFTKVISRYYGPSLPKIVEKLSIKCGVEKSLLLSPRHIRVVSRPGMTRSVSMGVLQKPNPLDLTSLGEAGGPGSSKSSTPTDAAPRHGYPMSRQSTSENARSVLNSSIFRNRQVAMTIGSVKGLDAIASSNSHTSNSGSSLYNVASQNRVRSQQVPSSQPRPPLHRSQTTSALNDQRSKDDEEEDDAPEVPQMARIKLKKFYHDRESEEVLKGFRRKGPLSKSDAIQTTTSEPVSNNFRSHDDDDLGVLAQYLPRGGTTSWGVIQSSNAQRPPSSTSQKPTSPTLRRIPTHSPPTIISSSPEFSATIVPSTPTRNLGYSLDSDGISLLRTPGSPSRGRERPWAIPTTPTRRDRIHQGQLFASQIRGSYPSLLGGLGSPGGDKRRIFRYDDDDDEEDDEEPGSGAGQDTMDVFKEARLHSPEIAKKMRIT